MDDNHDDNLMSSTTLDLLETDEQVTGTPASSGTFHLQSEAQNSQDGSLSGLQRVVLTGFMGAGKSTVGRLLARELGWSFVDVDSSIEATAGMTVAEVFGKYGEFVFRKMETLAVAHALGEKRSVIALGGGAPEVLANRLLLEQTPSTAVVFLEAPLGLLLTRCATQQDAAVRPNLLDTGAAEERFRYRTPLYRRCARFRVQTEGQTPAETVVKLLELLRS